MAGRIRLISYVFATVFLPAAAVSVGITTAFGFGGNRSDLFGIVLVVTAVASLAAYASLHVAQRVVAEVTETVTERARGIAAGHLGTEPVPVRGMPELARLGSAFNDMVRTVRAYVVEAQRSQGELGRALQHLGSALSGSHDVDAIAAVTLETAELVSGARTVVLWAVEDDALLPRRVQGETRVRDRLGLGEGLAGKAAESGDTVSGDDRAIAEPHHEHAVAVPLTVGDQVIAVLAVYGRRTLATPFSLDDIATIETLARQAETALDNARLHAEAARLAVTDPLTGLANRRQLEQRMAIEVSRAHRYGDAFAVAMVDIDDFKAINDRYGHRAGDKVLVEVARRVLSICRSVDLVARFGGEELLVLLPGADTITAAKAASRIRQVVARTPVVVDGADIPVTVSVGLAGHPEHGTTAEEVLVAADDAMYRAKRAGKNRVERASVDG